MRKEFIGMYDTLCCTASHQLEFKLISNLRKLLIKAAEEIFNRTRTADQLDKKIIDSEVSILTDGLDSGLGIEYRKTSDASRRALRTNLVSFAATKNYVQQREMIAALVDENGNIRSFSQFKKEVIKLGEEFNKNWLRTEFNTVRNGANMATKWFNMQKRKKVLPYVVYKSQDDSKVRASHQALHNVVKHIDDPFWDTYWPPNGWNCRCYVLQRKNVGDFKTEPDFLPDDKNHPPVFKTNPGKSLEIFSDKHPYFETVSKSTQSKIIKTFKSMIKDDPNYKDIVERL